MVTTFEDAIASIESYMRYLASKMTSGAPKIEAEDLYQETMMELWSSWGQFDPNGPATYMSYARSIMGRTLWGMQNRKKRVEEGPSLDNKINEDFADYLQVKASSNLLSTEDYYLNSTISPELVRAVNCLSPKYKETLVLVDIEGLRPTEVAAQLEVSITTITSRLSLARKKMREHLNSSFRVAMIGMGKFLKVQFLDIAL